MEKLNAITARPIFGKSREWLMTRARYFIRPMRRTRRQRMSFYLLVGALSMLAVTLSLALGMILGRWLTLLDTLCRELTPRSEFSGKIRQDCSQFLSLLPR